MVGRGQSRMRSYETPGSRVDASLPRMLGEAPAVIEQQLLIAHLDVERPKTSEVGEERVDVWIPRAVSSEEALRQLFEQWKRNRGSTG
jgi:hypothetical protein